MTISYSRFDRLQVGRSFDELVIIWGIGNLYWAMEDASVSELAYLVMEERYDVLEYPGGCFGGCPSSLLGWH